MKNKQRQCLVTTALPYANGDIHLGHLVENIQADIWVRFLRLQKHHCVFVSGTDCHGTPVMLRAEKEGVSPEELVKTLHKTHLADIRGLLIHHDNFYTTHSPENEALVSKIYNDVKKSGDITTRTISQAYDAEKNMFLPDRFVKGECPKCGTADQHGDNCEACGATYNPTDLKNPVSVISGTTPTQKNSEHYFFQLGNYQAALEKWMEQGTLQPQVLKKLKEWFEAGLKDWDISRDAPYFGFEIPEAPGKFFYVWLDAPIGYMASLKNYCDQHPELDFDAYWKPDTQTELYHFIGKDIMYFHALFWPAVLMSANLRTPSAIFVNGFLTIGGQKLSKSRGTFINASTYLKHLNPEYYRYYIATKLNGHIEDMDLNFEDFVAKINSDLVGKVVNIASRTAGFITKNFDGELSSTLTNEALMTQFTGAKDSIGEAYEKRDFNLAARLIMGLADKANQYIAEVAPWKLIKEDGQQQAVHDACTLALNCFKALIIYLKPILPVTAERAEAFLNCGALVWDDIDTPLLNHKINKFKPLLTRIETKDIEAMTMEAQNIAKDSAPKKVEATKTAKKSEFISIDDFAKIDLRVAKIIDAQDIDGADKLLQLTLDVGDSQRQVFAGIKKAYKAEDLIGQFTVVVANLAPRKMRFGMSEGMVLVASGDDKDGLWLISPESGATPGMKVK